MTGNPGTGVLGVEDGVDDELAHVIVLQAVEDGGPVPAGAHQTRHPQLRQVLGDRRRRLAHVLGEFVDRHLAMRQRPEHLHAGGVGQHPENLDHQTGLVVGQPSFDYYLHAYADNTRKDRRHCQPCFELGDRRCGIN